MATLALLLLVGVLKGCGNATESRTGAELVNSRLTAPTASRKRPASTALPLRAFIARV
jgi:hypothetical protein